MNKIFTFYICMKSSNYSMTFILTTQFQMFNNYMWLVNTLVGSTDLKSNP